MSIEQIISTSRIHSLVAMDQGSRTRDRAQLKSLVTRVTREACSRHSESSAFRCMVLFGR
jgi:hypothetical protein